MCVTLHRYHNFLGLSSSAPQFDQNFPLLPPPAFGAFERNFCRLSSNNFFKMLDVLTDVVNWKLVFFYSPQPFVVTNHTLAFESDNCCILPIPSLSVLFCDFLVELFIHCSSRRKKSLAICHSKYCTHFASIALDNIIKSGEYIGKLVYS